MQHQQTITVPLELKALNARQIQGHGSVFGNVDLGGDVVMRGAFLNSLNEHDKAGTMPQMFWMHSMSQVPGRWDEMSEDSTGLLSTGTLAKTPLGDEMRTLAKMKAVRGLSIGFFIRDDEFTDDGIRVIKEVDLIEVSLVSLAMNPLAQIESAKSRLSAAGEYVPTSRQFERSLRDVGLSKSVSKTLVAAAFGEPGRDVSGPESEGIAALLESVKRSTEQTQVDTIRTITRQR